MYQRNEQGFGQGAVTASLSLADAITTPLRSTDQPSIYSRFKERIAEFELVPDLGQDIGSKGWFRGLFTLTALCTVSLLALPGLGPVYGAQTPAMSASDFDEARAQMIMPLAFGGDTGRRMAATDAVRPLKESPERPQIQLNATLGRGDSFSRVLQRAGVGGGDARKITSMVASAIKLSDIDPGTNFDITLGRRASRNEARPIDALNFRARFDLNLEVSRNNGQLALTQHHIKVDNTPLRIRGTVGSSLYRSARAAGAPPRAAQDYLKVLAQKLSLNRGIKSTDEFDLIVAHRRAETGEVELGKLLYAGIERDGKPKAQLVRWKSGGRSQWFEASGVGEQRGQLSRPVNGRITSGYGMRRHPILRYRRMHSGLDFKARRGTPIHAASDGVVSYAGRKGGYGKYVRIKHGGGLASGYAHMSRIAARSGSRVRRGQIIGYVGSTGLSTGPHLHYELYRGNRTINPRSVRFTTRAQLSGRELRRFKSELKRLKQVKPGAAIQQPKTAKASPAEREIARLGKAKSS